MFRVAVPEAAVDNEHRDAFAGENDVWENSALWQVDSVVASATESPTVQRREKCHFRFRVSAPVRLHVPESVGPLRTQEETAASVNPLRRQPCNPRYEGASVRY